MPGVRGQSNRQRRVARMRHSPYPLPTRRTASRAASVIQRRFRARRPVGRMAAKVNKYNVEIKSIENPEQVLSLRHLVGSSTAGPSNSVVFSSGLFGARPDENEPSPGLERGVGCDQLIGCWIQEAYPHSLKFELNYTALIANGAGVFPSLNVEVIHGMILNTGAKAGILGTSGSKDWQDSIDVLVKKELYDSGYDADHLSYVQRNRRVKVLKKYTVRPKQGQLANISIPSAGANVASFAPNYEGQHKFPHSKMKTRLMECTPNAGMSAPVKWVPNSLWIPFTMITAPGLEAAQGSISVSYVSKAYLRDS